MYRVGKTVKFVNFLMVGIGKRLMASGVTTSDVAVQNEESLVNMIEEVKMEVHPRSTVIVEEMSVQNIPHFQQG